MKQNRYIPGDLIYYRSNVETVVEVDRDNHLGIGTDKHPFASMSNIEPVPLTSAILEKNGWERLKTKRLTWWRIRLGNTYFYIKQNRQFPTIWFICRGKSRHVLKRVKYIHQLQHLLFGLDLNSDMEV